MPELTPEALEALTLLYLTFGHATDGALHGDEMRMLAKQLQRWSPGSNYEALGHLITRCVGQYKATTSIPERLDRASMAASQLKGALDVAQLRRVLEDLRELGLVDGHLSPEEEAFIEVVADRLDLEL